MKLLERTFVLLMRVSRFAYCRKVKMIVYKIYILSHPSIDLTASKVILNV